MALVRRASDADRARTVALTTDAFSHDPVIRWCFPDDETYPARAAAFFGFLFDIRVAVDGVWVTNGGESAALWSPPGPASPGAGRLWEAAAAQLSADEIERCDAWDAAVEPHHPASPHWYLGVLATAPAFQGRGLGPAVAQPGIEAAVAAGLPAFLETGVEANVELYERMGFRVTGEIDDPSLPRGWCLRRDPDAEA
jgi:ribosomal protein S18 acetylase RimI-like enzyme